MKPPTSTRIETQEVHVRERERVEHADTDAHPEFPLNLPSARPTYQQSGGSVGAGSGSKDSQEGSGGHESSSYKVGQAIFQRSKVKVYQCMQSSGKFVTMKYVYVKIDDQLSEDDMNNENVTLCHEIVDLVKAKLFPLSHPCLVKYIHAHFDPRKRRKPVSIRSRDRFRVYAGIAAADSRQLWAVRFNSDP
jgi:hypothetical protein